jgi:hypothetical protein
MSLDDMRQEWRKEMDRAIPRAEIDQLLGVVQRRCAEMERQVHGRDIREILAAVFVVGVFAMMWPVYRTSLVAALGVVLIVLGAGLIIYVLLSSKAPAPTSFQVSVLEYSRNRLAWLDRQIGLLRNVVWWYVAPICVGCLLFGWGLTGGSILGFGVHAAVVLAICAGIVYLNQWTVRHSLEPVRDELKGLIASLERTQES